MVIALFLTALLQSSKAPVFPKVESGGDLGKRRYRLIRSIEQVVKQEGLEQELNYCGYMWQGDEGGGPTYFLFPVGESRRVFFFTEYMRRYYGGRRGLSKGTQLVTCFELQKDCRPKRVWQVATVWSKLNKTLPTGTLAHFYRLMRGERLPNREDADYRSWTNKKMQFAKYYFDRFNNAVVATFVKSSGREINDPMSKQGEFAPGVRTSMLDVEKVGLPIRNREIKAMKKR